MGQAVAHDETRGNRLIILMAWLVSTVWLVAMIQPVAGALSSGSSTRIILALIGLALFLAIYLWATGADAYEFAMTSAPEPERLWRRALPAALLTLLGFIMIWSIDVSWGTLFIFAAVAAARRMPVIPSLVAIALLTVVPLLGAWRGDLSLVSAAQAAVTVAIVGVTVIGMRWSFITNRSLRIARRELARLAITEERLRFARDLHDLLGHTLSLIALKSELAGRLAPSAPERAQAELGDIERAARQALRDVRAAVAGYRQITLASELDAARDLLAAAGITCAIHGESVTPPPAVEAALAWATREGCANTVRHSHAHSCAITLGEGDGAYTLLIEDDGRGSQPTNAAETPGNGLRGLAERVTSLGGALSAGPRPSGGYALCVTLPAAVGSGPEATIEPREERNAS
jgi:two-component system sensor histidine kinase DesK